MTFWELFTALASAASIISFGLAISSIYNGRATRRVVRETNENTQTLIKQMQEDTNTRIDGTQHLIAELHTNTLAVLERMDQRAEERHRT
jgi:hypothetical protein